MMGMGVTGEVGHCVAIVWSQPWLVWAKHSLALHGFTRGRHETPERQLDRIAGNKHLQTFRACFQKKEILNSI